MPTSAIGRASKTDTQRRPISGPCPRLGNVFSSSACRPACGFSLLEVLVVVFIVGILATMFTLSVGVTGGDRQLDTEINRLIAVITLANEEAVIQGQEIGMRITSDGYRFATYREGFIDYPTEESPDESEWIPLESSDLLGPRRLPEGMLFELTIDGREIVLKSAADEEAESAMDSDDEQAASEDSGAEESLDERKNDGFEPQVMIFSSGDMDPFEIRLRREFSNSGKTIEFAFDGSTEIEADTT